MKKKLHVAIIVEEKKNRDCTSLLKNAEHIASVMEKTKFIPFVFQIEKNTEGDMESELLKNKFELACIGFRGIGELGHMQHICERASIPYSGSGALTTTLCANKFLTARMLGDKNFNTPLSAHISRVEWIKNKEEILKKIKLYFGNSIVIKPNFGNELNDVTFIKDQTHIPYVLNDIMQRNGDIVIQEKIEGKEVACFVLDQGFSESTHALVPVPIQVQLTNTNGVKHKICPFGLLPHEEREIKKIAKACHKAFKCSGYSKIDMIKNKQGIWNILEINSVPEFHDESIFRESLRRSKISEESALSSLFAAALYKKTRVV